MSHCLLGLGDEIGAKDYFLTRFDPVERASTTTTIECFKRYHPDALLITIVVRKLRQWQALVQDALMI
jgi:hypothetical protein